VRQHERRLFLPGARLSSDPLKDFRWLLTDARSGAATRCRKKQPNLRDKEKTWHSCAYRTQILPSWLRGTRSGGQPRPVRVDWITDDRRDHAAVTQEHFDCSWVV